MKVAISPPFGQLRAWGILLLIVSVILGVALPILLRTLFNSRAVEAKRVALVDFVAHQQRLVVVSISAAYVAGVAYLLLVPNLYLYGSVLAGLYGIYSAIPSERKLKGELRFYRVGDK
jgi:predicted secreted protein